MQQENPIGRTIHGDLGGLKPTHIKGLEKLYKRRIQADQPITQDFATQLTFLSAETNRVVAVLVDRRGRVEHVMIGDAERVYLPDIGRGRAAAERFRGIRLVRTSPTSSNRRREVELTQEDVTDLQKLRLDMVMTIGVAGGGYPGPVVWAHLVPPSPEGDTYRIHRASNPAEVDQDWTGFIAELEAEFQRKAATTVRTGGHPATLVYVSTPGDRGEDTELHEMLELCPHRRRRCDRNHCPAPQPPPPEVRRGTRQARRAHAAGPAKGRRPNHLRPGP